MNAPAKSLTLTHRGLPVILSGAETPAIQRKVHSFYGSIAEMYERWVTRRQSPHTQRAYRQDIMALVKFMKINWPDDAMELLRVSVADVQRWRDQLASTGAAPKTINRRISSLSSLYRYIQGSAAEFRLPITVPNPAHAQFIAREASDPREETKPLTATRARQLMAMPSGDSLVDYRDRAILKFYLYTGARLSAGCALRVSDFHQNGEEATIRIKEKGNRRRTIGLHFSAAEAIGEYIEKAQITRGALFRPRKSRSDRLAERSLNPVSVYLIIQKYLSRLPGAMKEHEAPDATKTRKCIYSPHSLRATTATLLLDAGAEINKVRDLLGHKHLTTTQIYDKRRIATSQSASHEVPI